MCWMALIPAAIAVGQGVMGKANADNQAAYLTQIGHRNAAYREQAAQDAERIGSVDADRYRRSVGQMIGTQRTAFASGNIDVNSGTAAEIQDDTAMFGELDALTIANNAAKEAWGYRVAADNELLNARVGKSNAQAAGTGSILGGIGGAFSAFSR